MDETAISNSMSLSGAYRRLDEALTKVWRAVLLSFLPSAMRRFVGSRDYVSGFRIGS